LFLQPSETRLLLEPQVGCLEALLPSRQPNTTNTLSNQFNALRHRLTSR
jgi:hypothetical protein